LGDGIGGLIVLAVTIVVLGILDVDVFWPLLVGTAGGWAVPIMAAVIIVEGVGIYGELEAL
jgi:hypothetical protein